MASDKLNQELNSLIELTRNGKIPWSMQANNPNFYKWDRTAAGKTYQVSIQSQNPGHPTAAFFFFSIIKTMPQPQEVILQINSQADPESKVVLNQLFTEAQNGARNQMSNLLTELMKGL